VCAVPKSSFFGIFFPVICVRRLVLTALCVRKSPQFFVWGLSSFPDMFFFDGSSMSLRGSGDLPFFLPGQLTYGCSRKEPCCSFPFLYLDFSPVEDGWLFCYAV